MYKKCISIVFDFTRLLLCTRNAYRSSLTSLDFYYVQEMHIDRLWTSLDVYYVQEMHIDRSLTSVDFHFVKEMIMSLTSLDFYYVQEMHIDRL